VTIAKRQLVAGSSSQQSFFSHLNLTLDCSLFSPGWSLRRNRPVIEPISRDKYTFNTALLDRALDVVVDTKRVTLPLPGPHKPSSIKTKVIVNKQLAHVRDIVGLNGAIHVVDKLLDPRKHCHQPPEREDEQAWEDWEEWLPQWADAN